MVEDGVMVEFTIDWGQKAAFCFLANKVFDKKNDLESYSSCVFIQQRSKDSLSLSVIRDISKTARHEELFDVREFTNVMIAVT